MYSQETLLLRPLDLQTLQEFRWPDGLATSCYLNVDGRQWVNHGGVMTQLHSMISKAKASIEQHDAPHAARVSARRDLEELADWVSQNLTQRSGASTLAWFSCSEHNILIARWLPMPLPNRLVQAEDFDETLLLGAIRSVPVIGLVVIDHASVRYYHADASQIVEIAVDAPDVQAKIRARESQFGRKAMMPDAQFGQGNVMEKRLQNRRDHLLHRHIDTVVPRLGRLARADHWSHLLVGGESKAAAALLNQLHADLRRLDVQAIDLPAKADSIAIKTLLHNKLNTLRDERFQREYRTITEDVLPELRAVRLGDVCAAASLNAIQLLLVEPAPLRAGRYCERCGWLGLNAEARCRYCEAQLISSPHIYDNLADAVLAAGGDVFFTEKTVLPPQMEHVAARLRFPLTDSL